MRLRKSKQKEEKVKLTWKERLIKLGIYLFIGIFAFGFIWTVFAHERADKLQKKKDLVQSCYDTMYIASGYILSYTIDVSYVITNSNGSAGTVTMTYLANEEVDQVNQRKRVTLVSQGYVMDTEYYDSQVYYYGDGRVIREVFDNVGEMTSYEESETEISFEYNPMLSFASMILDNPGEFVLKGGDKTIAGSISLKDISNFLMFCPYSALFNDLENTRYYVDQVNKITITTDNGYFKTSVIDLTRTAASLVGPFYEEMGSTVEVDHYTITMYVESWEKPEIEMPEQKGEISE